VHIPLTVFTMIGGAVALGVGFGSQNIVNNFISGLILHAERPVRVGDLIQFNDQFGVVEEIGPRSTRVITPSNLEVIVPNSSLLESNVVNWTLSNRMVRSRVRVGVAYGSPTRELSRLLVQAAAESEMVLPSPEPFVLFTDFAENSLNFELHFWIQMSTITEHQRIESEIRYRIEESFSRAGISMPFPQRDVHLQLNRPLDIRLDVQGQGVGAGAGMDVLRNVA
jgi:small-conductance mechanosensitive channel